MARATSGSRRRAWSRRLQVGARGANDPTAAGRDAAAGRAGAAPTPPVPGDAHVLKFSRDGKFLLQIGAPGKMDGPDSQTTLNRPSAVAYDAAANEVFVADTGNRRIVVFDADKGTYKRHWFAYGEKAAAAAPGAYAPNDPPAKSFRDVTCIDIARDGQVYVCDRSSNRIQVFRKDGTFVREGIVSKNTLGATVTGQFGVVSSYGSAWDSRSRTTPSSATCSWPTATTRRSTSCSATRSRRSARSAAADDIQDSSSPSAVSPLTRRATCMPVSSITASACRSS